jgi:dihydroxyacetone kinase-like protein
MGFTISDLSVAVERAHAAMSLLEQELNAADAKLGEGDAGSK